MAKNDKDGEPENANEEKQVKVKVKGKYMNMSKKELATRTELTEQTINRIFKSEQPITYATANKLELATGVPARMWNNLEARYREQLAKIEEREQFNELTRKTRLYLGLTERGREVAEGILRIAKILSN